MLCVILSLDDMSAKGAKMFKFKWQDYMERNYYDKEILYRDKRWQVMTECSEE